MTRLHAFFYQTPAGNEPIREWLMNLSPADRKLVGTDIKDVEYAWPLGKPLVDSLETQERMNIMAKHIGSSFDSWLQQEGVYEEVTSVAPPGGLWPRIARQLPANDNAMAGRLSFWRNSALAGYALAAASLAAVVVQVNQPPTVVQAPAAQGQVLNASLMSQDSRIQPLFVAAYDPDRNALIITSLLPAGTDPAHVHELWLIHGKDKPMPLGFVVPGKSKMIALPKTLTGMMAEGSALAISVEAPGGSTNPDGPTGPIAAVGKLTKL